MSRRKEDDLSRLLQFSLRSSLAHISENWCYKIESHLTNQENCDKSYFPLYPFIEKEQDCQYTTQEVDWNAILFLWDIR